MKQYKVYGIVWCPIENPNWEHSVPYGKLPKEVIVSIDEPVTADRTERIQLTRDEIVEELEDRYSWEVDEFCFKEA